MMCRRFRPPAAQCAALLVFCVMSQTVTKGQSIPATAASKNTATVNDHTRGSPDPEAAQFITSDIDHFWRAYDKAGPNNACAVFQDEYINKGSIGLRDFVQLRIDSACTLANWVARHPLYYASIRPITQRIPSFTPQVRQSFRKLKELYPAAVFPNVYFVIGRMNSAGTVSYNGLLIGAEMYGQTPDMPSSELTEWHKAVLQNIDKLPGIVAHELIHFQQPEHEHATLLSQSIVEGSADFVGELISGQRINSVAHEYGDKHERELWTEFKQTMHGVDTSAWLYNGDNAKTRPADLGYYIGFKIAEAYYAKSPDKKAAIREILQVTDYDQLLKASGYDEKLEKNTRASTP